MYPRFLAISAAIFFLSPVNASTPNLNPVNGGITQPLNPIDPYGDLTAPVDVVYEIGDVGYLISDLHRRSKMDLTGPRFGLPATSEKAAASRSNFVSRDFFDFLTGGSPKQQTAGGGNNGYNNGGAHGGSPPPAGAAYPPSRSNGEDREGSEDRQAGDVFDEGDDQPDRNSHGGQAKKRSLLATLSQKQKTSGSGDDGGDGEGSGGPEAKRSLKALRRRTVRRDIRKRKVIKRSTKGTIFKAEMGLDSTVQDAEKLVNGALSHGQSVVNSAASDLTAKASSKAAGTSSSPASPGAAVAKQPSTTTNQSTTEDSQSTGQGQSTTEGNQLTSKGQSTTEDNQSTGGGQPASEGNQPISEGGPSEDDYAQMISYYNGGSEYNSDYFEQ